MIFFSNLSPGGLPRTSPSSRHLDELGQEGPRFLVGIASNLRPQLPTHSLKRSVTASRLLSHHSALYVTPTSRCAVGS
jgi:hypothetical protein